METVAGGCGLFVMACVVLFGCFGYGVELLEHRHIGATRILELLMGALMSAPGARQIDGLVDPGLDTNLSIAIFCS
jgi:hypothetical protein